MLYLQWAVVAIATLFPVISFLVPKGVGASFYLLLLCSFAGIILRLGLRQKNFTGIVRRYWPVHLAMSGLLVATIFNQLANGSFVLNALELPFHLASFPLLFGAFLLLTKEQTKGIWCGVSLGAIVCAIRFYIESSAGALRPPFVFNIPLIPFANLMLLLGVLALHSVNASVRSGRFVVWLKIMACMAALYGSYLTQARGGWIALPVFAAITLLVFKHVHIRHKVLLLLFSITVVSGTYLGGDKIRERISAGKVDIEEFVDGRNKDTSLGLRLQNWQGGWVLFADNPLFGVGRKNYPSAVRQLSENQIISPAAAVQPHTHNDILFQMASLGIFGLLAMISLYFVPAYYFFRAAYSPDRQVRAIAGMGLTLTVGFFVYGLSDTMFFWKISYVFYTILLAVLFSCLVQRDAKLEGGRAHAGIDMPESV